MTRQGWKSDGVAWPFYEGRGPTWKHATADITIEGWAGHVRGRRRSLRKRRAHHVMFRGANVSGEWGFDRFVDAAVWAERFLLTADGRNLLTADDAAAQ